MAYWVVNGKQLNEKQYAEYQRKQIEAEELAQEEAQRLVGELSQAYKACAGFMEEHPELCHKVSDAEAREHELYLKLRDNLTHADRAPRCEKVREDGTECFSPQMKGYSYCYAHERMLQARPHKLELPAVEDANGVQMAIMRVQKALIDDEISEKKASLLLYSLQIAASNVKSTTFNRELGKLVVAEMPVVIESPIMKKQVLPLINTDNTDQKKAKSLPQMNVGNPAVSTQQSARARQKLTTDEPEEIAKIARTAKIAEIEEQGKAFTTEATEEQRVNGRPQPRADGPHEDGWIGIGTVSALDLGMQGEG